MTKKAFKNLLYFTYEESWLKNKIGKEKGHCYC